MRKLILAATAVLLIVAHQNCSDVGLIGRQIAVLPQVASGITGQFCSAFAGQGTSQFVVNTFGIINLNGVFSNKVLKPDSDGDGVADADEASFGTQTLNRRSHRIFDGLCAMLGGVCNANPTCNMTAPKGLLLTQCDLDSFSGVAINGLDADDDLIPDFVEILRRTDPQHQDGPNDDGDGDTIPNVVEIRRGTNPIEIDNPVPAENLLSYSYWESGSPHADCQAPQLTYAFRVESVPLTSTLAFVETGGDSRFPLSHLENENVFLAYYIATSGPDRLVFAKVFNVRKNSAVNITLTPRDFVKVSP